MNLTSQMINQVINSRGESLVIPILPGWTLFNKMFSCKQAYCMAGKRGGVDLEVVLMYF